MPYAQVHYPFERKAEFEATLPRRLHRRVHRADARLVLHAGRAVGGAVRRAAVQGRGLPRRDPRRGRPQDVQAAEELSRPDGAGRGARLGRAARRAAVVGARWAAPTCASPRPACATPCAGSASRSGTPALLHRLRRASTGSSPTRPHLPRPDPARPLPAQRDRGPARRRRGGHGRLRLRRRLPAHRGVRDHAQHLVHPPVQAAAVARRASTRTSGTPTRRSISRCRRWPWWPRRSCRSSAESVWQALGENGERAPGRLARGRRAFATWRSRPRCPPLREVVRLARSIREENKLKHRHPLPSVAIAGVPAHAIADNLEMLREELNVKSVRGHRAPRGDGGSGW